MPFQLDTPLGFAAAEFAAIDCNDLVSCLRRGRRYRQAMAITAASVAMTRCLTFIAFLRSCVRLAPRGGGTFDQRVIENHVAGRR